MQVAVIVHDEEQVRDCLARCIQQAIALRTRAARSRSLEEDNLRKACGRIAYIGWVEIDHEDCVRNPALLLHVPERLLQDHRASAGRDPARKQRDALCDARVYWRAPFCCEHLCVQGAKCRRYCNQGRYGAATVSRRLEDASAWEMEPFFPARARTFPRPHRAVTSGHTRKSQLRRLIHLVGGPARWIAIARPLLRGATRESRAAPLPSG